MRKRLPPIFDRVRLRLASDAQPPVLLHFPDADLLPDRVQIQERYGEDGNVPLMMFTRLWLEVQGAPGMLADGDLERIRLRVFDHHGDHVDSFDLHALRDVTPHPDAATYMGRRNMAALLIYAMHFIWKEAQKPAAVAVNTFTRNSPAFYARQGDTLRFVRAADLHSAGGTLQSARGYTPPAEPSGIRKRDHAVRGHWRTYRSGVRVWVHAHRRGDPLLGTSTRVVQV